jgi:HlyD family secretion protein
MLRFSAFNLRSTPEIEGKVARVSADATTEPRTGQTYYLVRIDITSGETAKLGKLKIVPGMPVEVFMRTEERTVISYLTKPLTDQLERTFREK